jgi:hypothetical protein
MGVLGAPLLVYTDGAIRITYMYLSRLSIQTWLIYQVLVCSVLTIRSLYKPVSTRTFKFVWGLPAGIEDPQIRAVDNLLRCGS